MKPMRFSPRLLFSQYIPFLLVFLALSAPLQLQLKFFGFYAAEVLLIIPLLLGQKWLHTYLDYHYFIKSSICAIFVVIVWTLLSLLVYSSDYSLIFSEARSLIWLCFGFYFCRAFYRRTGLVVPKFLAYVGLLYPIGYLNLHQQVIASGGSDKLYLNLPLLVVSIFTSIYYRSRLSWLILFAWLPVVYLSLFRQSYLVYLALVFLLLLGAFTDLNSLTPKSFARIAIPCIILSYAINLGFHQRFIDYAIYNLYPQGSSGYHQIIYKTIDSDNDSSSQLRFEALWSSFTNSSIMPTPIADGTFDSIIQGKINTRDSGFIFVTRRLGVLGLFVLFYLALSLLFLPSLAALASGLLVFFLMYVTGAMFHIGYVSAMFGVLLHILLFPSTNLLNFVKKTSLRG